MAGEIDLFSGNDPIAGINLFNIDKNPLDRLDQGIAGMFERAGAVGDAITDVIQAIIDAILGFAGGTLVDLAEFFLNLGPNLVKFIEGLTGLNIDEGPAAFIQSLFVKLEAATGLNWDEGPVRFLTSLFDAIIGQLERLTGLDFGDGPINFFNSILLRLEAATGLEWNSGPLAFLASLFDALWTQLNDATDLVWDQGPLVFIQSVLNKLFELLETLTGLELNSGLVPFLQSVVRRLGEIASALTALWNAIFDAIINIFEGLTGLELNSGLTAFVQSLINRVEQITGLNIDEGPIEFLKSLATLFNPGGLLDKLLIVLEGITGLELNSGLQPFLQSLINKIEQITGLNIDEGPIEFIESLLNPFEILWTQLNTLTGLVWDAGPLSFLNSLVNWVINNIFGVGGATAIFTAVRSFIAQFFDPTKGPLSGIFLLIKAVSDFFFQFFPWLRPDEPTANASATTTASTIADNIPTIRGLVGAVTGQTGGNNVDLGFGTLQQWARDIEAEARKAGDALNGFIGDLLSGTIPVAMLGDKNPNILVQGDFATAATIAPNGDGWAWDNTYTATPTGGAAKVTATGSVQQLFSNQTISVTPGDKIQITARYRTGTNAAAFIAAAGREIVLSIVPWAGTTRLDGSQAVHVVSTQTTASPSGFAEMSGPTVVIGGTAAAGEVALAANVTSIQVRLAVTANAGAVVWFDNISVIKTGLVQQGLVDGLPGLNDVANGSAQSGSNLLADPRIDSARLWKQPGLAVSTAFSNTTYTSTTTQSLEFSGNGSARSFYWPTNSLGAAYAIGTWPDRIYYVECYVYLPASNPNATATVTMFSQATIQPFATGTNISAMTFTSQAAAWSSVTLNNPVRGQWNRLYGYFKVPTLRNGFTAGITFTAASTHKVYVDDLVIQDVTEVVTTNEKLYGRPTPADSVAQAKVDGLPTLSSTVGGLSGTVSGLSGTVNGDGGLVKKLYGPTGVIADKIIIQSIPTTAIGTELAVVPVTGSGARVARVNTDLSTTPNFLGLAVGPPSIPALTATAGVNLFGVWENNYYRFFDTVLKRSSDITWTPNTGTFTVSNAGWYLVEVGFTVDASSGFAGAFNVAPIVVVNGELVKAGSDAWGSYGAGFGGKSRFAQSSFIIYVNAGGTIQAGYDAVATYPNFFRGQSNAAYTNFSISLMNKTAA